MIDHPESSYLAFSTNYKNRLVGYYNEIINNYESEGIESVVNSKPN
jgi:hypothetical protein